MPYEIDPETGLIHQVTKESNNTDDIYYGSVHPNSDVGPTLQDRDSFSRELMSKIYEFQKDDPEIPDRKVLSPAAVDLEESLLVSP
ncbi:hypothetical protein TWF506_000330 [Arthrobotrys conoides]|uniref:Uncharacterized protein n=1 Tax=Arthrobotrys conoides TaxID=74498 RepID=A0AAN8NVM5_9PEZI